MTAEVGEYLVGAWLKECGGCDFVDYGVRPRAKGAAASAELDVVGLHFEERTAYLCEVSTHLGGLQYGGVASNSIERVRKKHERQRVYASRELATFHNHRFQFWAPVVGKSLLAALRDIDGLELVVNEKYAAAVAELRERARASTRLTGNPFYRALQILVMVGA